ncbi:MAG: hypothetical protein ACRDHK_14730 [Actinomycetota bacterium]
MRTFTARRTRELRLFGQTLNPPQPNRGRHECETCALTFSSEAGFAYHFRTRGPRSGMECLNPRQLRSAGFRGVRGGWKTPAWMELWYVDEIRKEDIEVGAGFRREAWRE